MQQLALVAKHHWGLLLLTLLSGAYSLAVELYVESSAYNTTVHVLSNALAVAIGYPVGTWTARLYGRRLNTRLDLRNGDPLEPTSASRPIVAIAVAGRVLAAVSLVSIAVSGTLALVLAMGGLPVADVSLQWMVLDPLTGAPALSALGETQIVAP